MAATFRGRPKMDLRFQRSTSSAATFVAEPATASCRAVRVLLAHKFFETRGGGEVFFFETGRVLEQSRS